MSAVVTSNARAVRRAAPDEARGFLGEREPDSAEGGLQ